LLKIEEQNNYDSGFHVGHYVDKMRRNDGDEKRACIIRGELNH